MRWKANNSTKLLDESSALGMSAGIPEIWNSAEDGSNALVLPGNKKNNLKMQMKEDKKKERLTLSKSKQKKQNKLEEEKQKKLLLAKSIEIIKKHKIQNSTYSLLHSSGTIGQVETFKERRLRAVQLSKAGLQVPRDTSFKGKDNHKETWNNETTLEDDPDKSLSIGSCVNNLNLLDTLHEAKDNHKGSCSNGTTLEDDPNGSLPGGNCVNNINLLKKFKKIGQGSCSMDLDTLLPSIDDARERNTSSHLVDQKHSSIKSCTHGCSMDTVDNAPSSANEVFQELNGSTGLTIEEHFNRATVVHVSRPNDVEVQRKHLPIIMMEQEIMEAINDNFIVILCGETGCGKTTQVPQFLYEAGFGSSVRSDRKGIIGVTQPRRVAALATAKRVSYELGLSLGKEIGFQVRHDKLIGKNCSIKFMTDGILLREVQNDFLLKRYSVIILDEAHERSLNTDVLIGMLSRIIKLRQKLYVEQQEKISAGKTISPENMVIQLRLVLMSATLQVEEFNANRKLFDQSPPVLEVPVRQFPVAVHFSKRTNEDYIGRAYRKVMDIHKRLPPGGILVFVTGQKEVEFLCKKLRKASEKFSKSSSIEQLDNGLSASSGADIKEIDEAFKIENDSFEYDEDSDSDAYSDSGSTTDSDLDSERENADTIEAPDKSDLLLDSGSLPSLKSSFDALLGNPISEPSCRTEPSLQPASNLIKHSGFPTSSLRVLPLYAMLPASAQLRVFDEVPEGERLVVVATNVAETSLTIPGIKYVVDTGKEKIKNYNHSAGMATYEVNWISKASAAQRAGRAGRTAPGHCYRLYSSAAFGKDEIFPKFSCPEISRTPVDGVALLMKSMGIDKVANFPFPTPPNSEALLEAEKCLRALEALDMQGRLTPMGRAMAQYPMSPRHSRMLLTIIRIMKNQKGLASANLVLAYAIAAAAALSFPNPFVTFQGNHESNKDVNHEENLTTNKDKEEKQKRKKFKTMARETHARLCNPSSDALTVAYALQLFELGSNPVIFCKENFLHLKTMEEMSKLRKQLLRLVFHQTEIGEFVWNHGAPEDVELAWRTHSDKQPLKMIEEELIAQSICAGWADRISKRIRKIKDAPENDSKARSVRYQSCAMKDIVYLHSRSSVSQSAPEFLVYTELLQMKRPYMYGVTSVKSEWLLKYAASLCTFSAPLTDPKPYYEPLSDRVLCWVNPTFGKYNWQLPLHSIPVENINLRLSVFAAALLEGNVLPCLRSVQKFLAAPPSSMLRPEAMAQRRVGDLLNKLKIGSQTIDSRAILRDVWCMNPQFLILEIRQWFQVGFHDQFGELWERIHDEVRLEGHELFPKRAKKERKTRW